MLKSNLNFPKEYIIVDVGMHNGSDAEYYAKRGFNVIAFEANPLLANEGKERFEANRLPITVINKAIAESASEHIDFYINKTNDQFSSVDPKIGSRGAGAESIEVRTCNLAKELEKIKDRIHMIKIDIEGNDYIALCQLKNAGISPPFISVENGGPNFLEVMREMGYKRFKYSNQRYNSKQNVPKNSIHGNQIKHFFAPHSSGPFGEDLTGRWLTFDETIIVSNALIEARRIASNQLFAESIGWFDLHASF